MQEESSLNKAWTAGFPLHKGSQICTTRAHFSEYISPSNQFHVVLFLFFKSNGMKSMEVSQKKP